MIKWTLVELTGDLTYNYIQVLFGYTWVVSALGYKMPIRSISAEGKSVYRWRFWLLSGSNHRYNHSSLHHGHRTAITCLTISTLGPWFNKIKKYQVLIYMCNRINYTYKLLWFIQNNCVKYITLNCIMLINRSERSVSKILDNVSNWIKRYRHECVMLIR